MNMGLDWVEFLRDRGHDAEHWSRLGAVSASDEEILAYSSSVDAVILSNDLDFAHLHAVAGSIKPSIIQVRSDGLQAAVIGHLVARALGAAVQELKQGAIVTVKPPRVRISKLPIGNTDFH